MTKHSGYYEEVLYPVQDVILESVKKCNLPFYLTGGTAIGRGYFNHRYSDDLDFFVNADSDFAAHVDAVIDAISLTGADIEFSKKTSNDFRQVYINRNKNGLCAEGLKIDFVNDIPVHFGNIIGTKVYYRTDSLRNILSNKYTALYRMSAKDVADICEIAKHYDFDWQTIIADAEQKELGIDLNDAVQIFNSFSDADILNVNWKNAPDIERIRHDMDTVAYDMIVMQRNTLYKEYARHNVITLDESGETLLDRFVSTATKYRRGMGLKESVDNACREVIGNDKKQAIIRREKMNEYLKSIGKAGIIEYVTKQVKDASTRKNSTVVRKKDMRDKII